MAELACNCLLLISLDALSPLEAPIPLTKSDVFKIHSRTQTAPQLSFWDVTALINNKSVTATKLCKRLVIKRFHVVVDPFKSTIT